MALAQQTDLLLLDEPTTYSTMSARQVELLDLLTALNKTQRTTIVLVLHDLDLAFRYAHHLIALKDGQIAAEGQPTDIVDTDLITGVFGLDCQVLPCPVSGAPMVVPISEHDPEGDRALMAATELPMQVFRADRGPRRGPDADDASRGPGSGKALADFRWTGVGDGYGDRAAASAAGCQPSRRCPRWWTTRWAAPSVDLRTLRAACARAFARTTDPAR